MRLQGGGGKARDDLAQVLIDYIQGHTPITPSTDGRITAAP